MIVHYCDICHKEIPNAQEGYYLILKSAMVVEQTNPFLMANQPQPPQQQNLICAHCCAMVGKAILGKTPETKIQVVMSSPEHAVLLTEKDVLMTPSLSIILSATMVQKKVIEFYAEIAKKNGQEKNPTTASAI